MKKAGWIILLVTGIFVLSLAMSGNGNTGISIFHNTGSGNRIFKSDKTVWHSERITVELPAYLNASTFGGSITVKSHDKNEIVIDIYVRKGSNYLSEGEEAPVEITLTETPGGVEISAEALQSRFLRNTSVSYDILVPGETEVRANTSGGSVEAFDITHNVSLITSGGSVTAERISGNVLLRTSGGSISAGEIIGDITARTSGGGIRISDTSGKLLARTSGGSVRLDNVSGSIEARTSGGSINASIPFLEEQLKLHTSGGSITVALPRDQGLDILASGTNVRNQLDDLTGEIASRKVDGSIKDGGIPVELRTSGGSVHMKYR